MRANGKAARRRFLEDPNPLSMNLNGKFPLALPLSPRRGEPPGAKAALCSWAQCAKKRFGGFSPLSYSQRERENSVQSYPITYALEKLATRAAGLPLPLGEGRGEGNFAAWFCNRCSFAVASRNTRANRKSPAFTWAFGYLTKPSAMILSSDDSV
jgi:hypothetical protein